MDDIWSIIGLSSLIAAIVSVILGIIRDVFVDRYHFKRQSEAGYIQKQIQIYSQIYFVLKRIEKYAISPQIFGAASETMRELNNIMKENSSLIESEVLTNWLYLMALMGKAVEDKQRQHWEELSNEMVKTGDQTFLMIKEIMNKNLIPKYRKIVGKTVPSLE